MTSLARSRSRARTRTSEPTGLYSPSSGVRSTLGRGLLRSGTTAKRPASSRRERTSSASLGLEARWAGTSSFGSVMTPILILCRDLEQDLLEALDVLVPVEPRRDLERPIVKGLP